jgi:hypothetical protein
VTLRIRALDIEVDTSDGKYGARHTFAEGMNILRAENTAGKSTILRSILYALGLEGMMSPSHDVPLPHAVTSYIDLPNSKAVVLESRVTLEIFNEEGRSLTVMREIAGEHDKRIISVRDGGAISDSASAGPASDFFVRVSRSATSELGFHKLLAPFIGWDLPSVAGFDSSAVVLYMEALFPLFCVEQKLGWGRIPARFPTWLGIKDIRRRTIEFVLALDAYAIAEERLSIQAEMSRIRNAWSDYRETAGKRAVALGAILNALPNEPQVSWPPTPAPQIYVGSSKGGWESVASHVERLREAQRDAANEPIPASNAEGAKLSRSLEEAENAIAQRELALRHALQELEVQISESEYLQESIDSLREDQRKYKDLRRLRDMGADHVGEALHGICPTCNQEISDSLMDLGRKGTTMSVDQNIAFYDEQLKLSEAVLENAKKAISSTEARIASVREELARLRGQVRSIKETLTSPGESPSVESIMGRLRLDQRIERLQELQAFFDDSGLAFANLSDEWSAVLERHRVLPKNMLSSRDFDKLAELQRSLQAQLRLYGFESVDPGLVTISRDYYEPELEEINLAADAAASDVIRLQWAYLIALLETSNKFGGRHPQILILDEPQQQSAADKDFYMMLHYLSEVGPAQTIVATSHERTGIAALVSQTTSIDLWELGDAKLIAKL